MIERKLLATGSQLLESVADLNNTAIMVLGLWSMGIRDFAKIARLSGSFGEKGEDRLESVMIALQDSRNPVVQSMVRDGLPPGYYAPIGWNGRVLCKTCRCFVRMIPCPTCSLPADPVVDYSDSLSPLEEPPPLAPCGTVAMPGTLNKIEIMRDRFERGQAVFHPDDPVIG
jgi:hypothetical protein